MALDNRNATEGVPYGIQTMFARSLLATLFLLVATSAGVPTTAQAGYPSYLVLQTPPSGPRQISRGYNPGIAQGVSTPAYSYGYFGVQPREHAIRHYGFYRNYTECSWR